MEILNQIKEAISTTKPVFENSSLDSFLDISFKPNSDIGIVYDYIRNGMSGLILDENLSDNEKVIKILDNITSKFFDEDINIQYQNLLSIFCQKLANQFIYSRNIIKNEIGPVVDEIRNIIEKKVEEEFKKRNLGNLLSGDISLTTDQFVLFDWEGIKAPSSINNIITSASNYLKVNSDKITRNNFDIAVNYILTKDLRENYLTLDKEELKDKLDSELVNDDYFDILINKDEVIKFFRKLKSQLSDFKTIRFNIVNIVTSMNDLKSYLDKVINDKDKIEDNIYSKLLHNINILKLCIDIVLYCCLFFKEVVFSESVLINKQTVNNPVFEKYKVQGLSLEDLAAYIRVYYLDKDLPFKGVLVHNVLGANIQDELTKINNALLAKRKIYLKEFINKAFESVMIDEFEYLYKKFNSLMDEFSIEHLDDELKYSLIKEKYMKEVNHHKKYLYGDLVNVEKMIYLTIIESFFENSLIDLIFDIFNTKLENIVSQLKDNDDSDNSDILESTYVDIYIELIMYFLKKYFIEIG